jgi:hypothetical protein
MNGSAPQPVLNMPLPTHGCVLLSGGASGHGEHEQSERRDIAGGLSVLRTL